MDARGLGGMRPVGPERDAFHAAANFANRSDYATLILDRAGRILSCGASAENLLGDTERRIIGRRICDFVPGLLLNRSSPSFSARYLGHLFGPGEWCSFVARDAFGRAIAVEINLKKMSSSDPNAEFFLLNLRRSEGRKSLQRSS